MCSAAEKLQRHAEKFYRSSAPERVLERYSRKSEAMGTEELVRHISHVCAWIALAQPLKSAAKRTSDNGLSPVILLRKMLSLRGRARLDDRARAALSAVRSSCKLILGSHASDLMHDWQKLRDALPKDSKRKRAQMGESVAKPCHNLGGEESNIWMFRRARRLTRRICNWEKLKPNQRQASVDSFARRLAAISMGDTICSVQLRGLLYDVAAALSPPRGKSLQSNPLEPMDPAAVERLRTSALIQKELRRIMVHCIFLWRSRLQLEDEQLEPVLARVHYYIQRFEKRHGELLLARGGKQWAKLKSAIGNTSMPLQQPSEVGPTANPQCSSIFFTSAKKPCGTGNGSSTTKGGIYTPNERIRSFPVVKQRSDCVVRLFCSTCQHSITSDWYLEHTSGKLCLLRPKSGHMVRGRKICGTYVPHDGTTETYVDHIANIRKISEKMGRI